MLKAPIATASGTSERKTIPIDSLYPMAGLTPMRKRRNLLNLMSKVRAGAFHFLEVELARAGITDLSPSHGDVLFSVSQHNGLDMGHLAALTGRDKSTLTPLVEKLIRAGYLSRKVSTTDRRRAEIYLTAKAERLRTRLMKIGFRLEKIMHQDIPEADLENLTITLKHFLANLTLSPPKKN